MTDIAIKFINNFVNVILEPAAQVLLLVAVVVFVWGLVEFIRNADNPGGREDGRMRMIWGLVGIAIMISAVPIIRIALNTFGLEGGVKEVNKVKINIEKDKTRDPSIR